VNASARSASAPSRTAPSRNGSPDDSHRVRDALTNIAIPVATATIGAAGGVLLGRTARQRNRKVLGIQFPTKVDLGGMSHQIAGMSRQIGEAGRQFGNLAREVRSVREKAEQIGRVLK
jgi:hypothetical protein